MTSSLRIGLLQYDPHWLDIDKNIAAIEHFLRQSTHHPDILVLPEMFTTGYVLDTKGLKKTWQDKVTKEIMHLCELFQIVIMGSMPFNKQNRWYNTLCVWTKQGIIHTYDKIHLFSPAGEHQHYTPGEAVKTWTLCDWTMASFICYDLRFPKTSALVEVPHILFYVANWPSPRIQHWQALLKARAIENQAYVVGVNRTGKDENGFEYPGNSLVFDFSGSCMLELSSEPALQIITLDLDDLLAHRNKYPFLKDRKG